MDVEYFVEIKKIELWLTEHDSFMSEKVSVRRGNLTGRLDLGIQLEEMNLSYYTRASLEYIRP